MSTDDNMIVPPPPLQTVGVMKNEESSSAEIDIGSENVEFRLNITGLNGHLKNGYLRKKKNSKSPSQICNASVDIECQNKRVVLNTLVLTMQYVDTNVKKGRGSKGKKGGRWEKEFFVQKEERKNWKGKCVVSINPDDIYLKIFRQLSRNTHISDDDRKIPIHFQVTFFTKNGEVIVPKKHFQKLNTTSTPFFVCGWRKANKIEKKEKVIREKLNWKEKIVNRSQFQTVGVNPMFGGVVQPVSVYIMISSGVENPNEPTSRLVKYIHSGADGLEDLFQVFFGNEAASILSVSIETLHPLYNGCIRLVCLTPSVEMSGSAKVTVLLKSSSGSKEDPKLIAGEGNFTFIESTPPPTATSQQSTTDTNSPTSQPILLNPPSSSTPLLPPPPPNPQNPQVRTSSESPQTGNNFDVSESSSSSSAPLGVNLFHVRKKRKLNSGGIEEKGGK